MKTVVYPSLRRFKNMCLLGGPSGRDMCVSRTSDNSALMHSCYTEDTGCWETAVMRGSEIVVTEQYENPDDMHLGHLRWEKLLEENPHMVLKDIYDCG